MRALKESWKEAPQAIEELEKEGEVLVTRTVKDGQLRMVFWNEIKPDEESGGKSVEKGQLLVICGRDYELIHAPQNFLICGISSRYQTTLTYSKHLHQV